MTVSFPLESFVILLGDDNPWYLMPVSLYCSSTNLRASMSNPLSGRSCRDRASIVAEWPHQAFSSVRRLVSPQHKGLTEQVMARTFMPASYLSHDKVHLRAVVVVYAGLLAPDVACPHNHQPAEPDSLSAAKLCCMPALAKMHWTHMCINGRREGKGSACLLG